MNIPGYTLNQKMTEGGCSEVFSALEHATGNLVAIKLLHTQHLNNKVEYKRLQNEAAIGLKMGTHDNIVKTFSTGIADQRPYIVLEYVAGRTLRDVISDKRIFDDTELLALTKSLCKAISFVHAAGVIHKDIKPDNIMITHEGHVKLLDFGFAEQPRLFGFMGRSRALDGSPAYMAPELFSTKKATVATDIYAFGCTLYEVATGVPPFIALSTSQVISMQRNMHSSANSITHVNKSISNLTEKLILTACAKDVMVRFKSIGEILMELARNPKRPLTAKRSCIPVMTK